MPGRHRALGELGSRPAQAPRSCSRRTIPTTTPHVRATPAAARSSLSAYAERGVPGRRRRGGLQTEDQRAGEAAGVRAVEHPAGIRPGGEQPGNHVAGRVEHARVRIDRSPLKVKVIAGMTSIT